MYICLYIYTYGHIQAGFSCSGSSSSISCYTVHKILCTIFCMHHIQCVSVQSYLRAFQSGLPNIEAALTISIYCFLPESTHKMRFIIQTVI